MKTIYFGPVKDLPSWYWVGQDIAEFLKEKHTIQYFKNVDELENGAVVYWIKSPANDAVCNILEQKKCKIIFFPVDCYNSKEDLDKNKKFISLCSVVANHCDEMNEFFPTKVVQYVDHYNKFGISSNLRQKTGNVLWVGGFQYFPYFYKRYKQLKSNFVCNIVTDYKKQNVIEAANKIAKSLNLDYNFSNVKNLENFCFIDWSEISQRNNLINCKSAVDYKHIEDFNQKYKPPTKIQKYICSGIPTAINKNSYSYKYVNKFGLELEDMDKMEIVLTQNYQNKILELSKCFNSELSISSIASKYLDLLKWL